jgi:hypothetical protein
LPESFENFIKDKYAARGLAVGRPKRNAKVFNDFEVAVPLKTLARHGLIAGSTGTGKSRAIQLLVEGLAEQGVAAFLADVKGDVSGFCREGDSSKISERCSKLACERAPKAFTANYWAPAGAAAGKAAGLLPLRLKLSDVTPVLLARLMNLNPTQESHLAIAFIYAEKKRLDLVGLLELREVVEFLKDNPREMPGVNSATMNVILRKITEMQSGPINEFFGEPSLEVEDVLRAGGVNVLNFSALREVEEYGSVIIAFVLYKFFKELPEVGDVEKPKLVFFFDEAHALFQGANKSLVELMTTILRRIRSKGAGVFFITQDALDLPSPVLKLLGSKIQFAMRAFTKKELDDLKAVADSFPASGFYGLREELKSLAVGDSFVSLLSPRGESLPAVKVAWYPPESFMDAVPLEELSRATPRSLLEKYSKAKREAKAFSLKPSAAASAGRPSAEARVEKEEFVKGKPGRPRKFGRRFLEIVEVIVRAVGMVLYYAVFRPLKAFFRWLVRKPKRVAWFILLVIVLFLAWRYYPEVSSAAKTLLDFFDKVAGRA